MRTRARVWILGIRLFGALGQCAWDWDWEWEWEWEWDWEWEWELEWDSAAVAVVIWRRRGQQWWRRWCLRLVDRYAWRGQGRNMGGLCGCRSGLLPLGAARLRR